MYRQIKEMKAMLEGAPRAVEPAPAMGARADEPIAGVSLEQYAAISKSAAAFGHDATKMAEFAAARGFSELSWRAAVAGWNARLRAYATVARRFNLRYRES
jgi:hypothetical protein